MAVTAPGQKIVPFMILRKDTTCHFYVLVFVIRNQLKYTVFIRELCGFPCFQSLS